MKKLIALIALIATTPLQGAGRIAQAYYSPDRIVTINGQRSIQTMIEFRSDERIENIALGDSAAWQVTPNKRANLIFVKPLMTRSHTNMTVVTDKRRYLFDLVSNGRSGRPIYTIRFIYPEDFALPPNSEKIATAPPPPVTINNNWQAKGEKSLIPARIYDDGASTFLTWTDTVELPAILTMGTDGSEGPVNYTVKDGELVIEGVAPSYVLRVGKASATLTNLSPRPPKMVEPKPEEARP
jgi:type IV secretion system protein VirB9